MSEFNREKANDFCEKLKALMAECGVSLVETDDDGICISIDGAIDGLTFAERLYMPKSVKIEGVPKTIYTGKDILDAINGAILDGARFRMPGVPISGGGGGAGMTIGFGEVNNYCGQAGGGSGGPYPFAYEPSEGDK